MPSSVAMGPAAARLLRPGALSPLSLRKCLVGTVGVQFTRSASMPSKGKMLREMEKTAREGTKKTDMETMSQIQKRANDEYFRSGGGPLFPGEWPHSLLCAIGVYGEETVVLCIRGEFN